MKCVFVFLLMVLVPTFVWADMIGYSGDTRRYVTDAEKTQFPYNSVVRIMNKDDTGTGTFVSNDVILTCGNIVDKVGLENNIIYHTADGKVHTGYVASYKTDKHIGNDYAFIVDKGGFSEKVLNVYQFSKELNNLMVIGYDNLKLLSNEELRIIKQLYYMWLIDNDISNADNVYKAMDFVDSKLKADYACTSSEQKNCVHCSDNKSSCIFDDGANMKVRNGCKINYVGNQLYTNCSASYGAIGSAIIDSDTNNIVGILCEIRRPQIGQEKGAFTLGTKVESFYNNLMIQIEDLRYEEDE